MKLAVTEPANFTGTLASYVRDEDGRLVGQFRGDEENAEEFAALVKLWGAAPDLLEILQRLAPYLGDQADEGKSFVRLIPGPIIQEAKAAINKATEA